MRHLSRPLALGTQWQHRDMLNKHRIDERTPPSTSAVLGECCAVQRVTVVAGALEG